MILSVKSLTELHDSITFIYNDYLVLIGVLTLSENFLFHRLSSFAFAFTYLSTVFFFSCLHQSKDRLEYW